jgi:hypothetical protein
MDECPDKQCGCFVHVGFQALQRHGLGHSPVAFMDTTQPHQLDTGILPIPIHAAAITSWNDINPDMRFGPTATVGWMWGSNAIEVTGYYLPDQSDSSTTILTGGLFVPFIHPPIGFEGDNGLWSQADVVKLRLVSNTTNAELNYRCWSSAFTGPELILGARYFAADERVQIYTGDDDLTVRDINNLPDPLRQATYSFRTKNRLIAPQAGFEWNQCVLPCLTLNVMGKVALGPNLEEGIWSLKRGDGFEPLRGKQHETVFSELYELGAFADVIMLERMKLRFGYSALWFVNVAGAVEQVNYDLNAQGTNHNNHGSIFYHGPTVQFQIMF